MDGFHHSLVGKLKRHWHYVPTEKERKPFSNCEIIEDSQQKKVYAVKPYIQPKTDEYSTVLRDVNWNNNVPYRIVLDGLNCDIIRKNRNGV